MARDLRFCLRIKSQGERSSEQQGGNGSEKLAHGGLEQTFDGQHARLETLPKTGLRLGMVAHFLGLYHLIRIGRPDHEQARHGTQVGKMFDGLVGWTSSPLQLSRA